MSEPIAAYHTPRVTEAEPNAGAMNRLAKTDRPLYILGIDPGQNTGFAVYNTITRSFDALLTITHSEAMHLLTVYASNLTLRGQLLVRIEDPNLIAGLYGRHAAATTTQARIKVAQNVGMNKAMARELLNLCERLGCRVEAVKPFVGKKPCVGPDGKKIAYARWLFWQTFKQDPPSEHAAVAGLLAGN